MSSWNYFTKIHKTKIPDVLQYDFSNSSIIYISLAISKFNGVITYYFVSCGCIRVRLTDLGNRNLHHIWNEGENNPRNHMLKDLDFCNLIMYKKNVKVGYKLSSTAFCLFANLFRLPSHNVSSFSKDWCIHIRSTFSWL